MPVGEKSLNHQDWGGDQVGWQVHHDHKGLPRTQEDQSEQEGDANLLKGQLGGFCGGGGAHGVNALNGWGLN